VDLVDIVGCELPTSGYALITTSEDLSIESEVELFGGADKLALLRQPFELEESSLVGEFVSQAEADALARWGAKATALTSPQEVVKWSVANSILKVVLVAPSIGAYSTLISLLAKQLADVGVELIWYRREWDKQLLELADKGFFPYWERVKKRIGRGDVLFSGKSELVSL
jgi:hypothetical protein